MRVLWSQLSSSSLVVDVNDLLDCVSNIEVVHWGIIDYHVFIIHWCSISWSGTFTSLTFGRSSFSCTTKFVKLWLVLTDKSCRPLTFVLEVIDKFKLIKSRGCSWLSVNLRLFVLADNRSSFDKQLLPLMPTARVDFIRVHLLLMNKRLIRNVKDSVDHLSFGIDVT